MPRSVVCEVRITTIRRAIEKATLVAAELWQRVVLCDDVDRNDDARDADQRLRKLEDALRVAESDLREARWQEENERNTRLAANAEPKVLAFLADGIPHTRQEIGGELRIRKPVLDRVLPELQARRLIVEASGGYMKAPPAGTPDESAPHDVSLQ